MDNMDNMDNIDYVEEVLDQPDAERIINEVKSALDKEKKARHAFREWLTDDIKAEFINGEIVMHSPVKRGHLRVTDYLSRILSIYVSTKKLGEVSVEKALVALSRNDYEPDLCFWTTEQAKDFHKETMVHPAPALVVEILSKSTKSKDKGIKFKDYAAHGIPEYWIIDYKKETIDQYVLLENTHIEYTILHHLKTGEEIESQVVKGFKIPVKAIFDEVENLKALKSLIK